jgi:hypothetical protein
MTAQTIPFKVKRRTSGSPGAPASLLAGQIAYNEVDGFFYVGYGDDGAGNATSIKAFAKDDFNINKLIPSGGAVGKVLGKTGIGDYAVGWVDPGQLYTAGSSMILTGGAFTVDTTLIAALNSPAFTGLPTTPTQVVNDNSQKIASTAYADRAAANAVVGLASTSYVDSAVQGLKPKESVRVIATSNVSSLNGLQNIDGVSLAGGDRVLLPVQTTAAQSGVWIASAGAWTRALDMDIWAEVCGAYILAREGTVNGGHGFINTNNPTTAGTIGTTGQTWVEFTGASDITPGNGISKSGNTLSVNVGAGLSTSAGAVVVDYSVVAALNSPALTGVPTAPLAATGTSTGQLATTAFVQQELANLIIDGGTF